MHRLKVIFKHALKNALIPVVTICLVSYGCLYCLNIGGLGTKLVTALSNRDYTMIMAISKRKIVLQILLHTAYKLIDPRSHLNNDGGRKLDNAGK